MSDQPQPDEFHSDETPPPDPGPQSQEIHHQQVSALVPEHVAAGTFSTGAVVLQGAHEFILDFLLRMQQPQQVAARVVLPPAVVQQLIKALTENITKYENRFGAIPKPVNPQQQQQQQGQGQGQQTAKPNSPSAQELYEQLKLSDEVMTGDYANAVMIGHTATEFSFDFITTFFPRSCVARRVYLAAPNVPRLLDSLKHSFNQFVQRRQGGQQGGQAPPPNDPPPEPTDNPDWGNPPAT